MAKQSGKTRALRISLDYYKHRGALYWSRWACASIALVGSAAYGVFILAGIYSTVDQATDRPSWSALAARHVNTGPLSQAHRHLQDDCQACHASSAFLPIAGDAWQFNRTASLAELEKKCQACHQMDSHVANIANSSCKAIDQNCASCHREHEGIQDLSSVASKACTQCHANLGEACGGETISVQPEIAAFTQASHSTAAGTFRSLESDAGRIKFSHAQHLSPGQIKTGRRGGFRKDMLASRWLGQYEADADGLVSLNCGSCHQLQSPSGPATLEELRQSADHSTSVELSHFYAPIDFEEHCQACHQFTFAGQTDAMLPLPHAASKEEFRRVLSARLVGGRLAGKLSMPMADMLAANEHYEQVQTLVDEDLEGAVERVYTACGKCHVDPVEDEQVLSQLAQKNAQPMIPQHWLRHGLFEHGAHEKITNCSFCHAPSGNEDASAFQEVMIKGADSCAPCHRDATSGAAPGTPNLHLATSQRDLLGEASQPNLASDNCILCHRYHWSRPTIDGTKGASP